MARGALAALTAALTLGGAGCASTARQVYTPAELRAELLSRAPQIPAADLVVPFELPESALERARALVANAHGDADKIEILVRAMLDPAVFGLVNDEPDTTTGAEVLAAGRGNCVGLSSVFIGLARAVGLDARYVDASERIGEIRYAEDGGAVHLGHVTALVETSGGFVGLDFARAGPFRWYQLLDDLEALAHFHNNRGFDLIDQAREAGRAVDWPEAERRFRLAVAVKPGFARAWNNLGIAAARQGRPEEAAASYRQAAALDPRLSAPHANLGALALQAGDLPAALEALSRAAALDPSGAHIQYNLAVARLRSGDREGALRALHRALALRQDYPGAQALRERLEPGPASGG